MKESIKKIFAIIISVLMLTVYDGETLEQLQQVKVFE